MDVLLSFGAALLSLRLAGLLGRKGRTAWAGSLLSFAAATGAMAWGAAHGWDARSFRVYYLAGALLSAPLLGVGSLQLWDAAGRRRSASSTPETVVGGQGAEEVLVECRPREPRITSTRSRASWPSPPARSGRSRWSSSRWQPRGAGRSGTG